MTPSPLAPVPPALPRLLAIAALLLLSGGCGAPEPLRIGVVMGPDGITGARLAAADVNAAGGIGGRRLELHEIPAPQISAQPAIEAAEELAADAAVLAVVGHSNSAASLAASQVYNERGLTHLSPNATASLLREAGPHTFRMVPGDDRQAVFLAAAARRLARARRVVVLYDNDDYGRALSRTLVDALTAEGITVARTVAFLGSEGIRAPDVTAATLAADRPDVVYFLGRWPAFLPFRPALRRALPDAVVLASDALESAEVHARPADYAGTYFVRFVEPGGTPCLRRLGVRLGAAGVRVESAESALSYDAVLVLAEALRRGGPTREGVRAQLESVGARRGYAACAGTVRFDAAGDAERPYRLAHVTDAGVEPVP
jgi:branched-chain amino acid transport system substrate-binding protein